jgi:hypothetical protein
MCAPPLPQFRSRRNAWQRRAMEWIAGMRSLDEEFDQLTAGAWRWNHPVICNEFGVFRKSASRRSRRVDFRGAQIFGETWDLMDDVGLHRRFWRRDQAQWSTCG